ncbi:MAG: RidA family protein [Pararhizobium sp.]
MSTKIRRINPNARRSVAVVNDKLVYLTGQVADDVGQDIEGQTRQVLESIDRILASAGSDKDHIVFVHVWLKDTADFEAMNSVWESWVSAGNPPARATVGAHLTSPAYLVEMAVTAAVK